MKRKFVPVALAAVMAFNLAACDSKPAEPSTPAPDDGGAAPTAADTPDTPTPDDSEPVEPYTVRTKADGSAIDTIEIEISNGSADPVAVEDMAAGTYYVQEIEPAAGTTGVNRAVTLDTGKYEVTVTAGVSGADSST